jgi:DNA-binding NarL/FixJ family response regulator
LGKTGHHIEAKRLEATVPVAEQALHLPRATLYVLDSYSPRQLTSVLVSNLLERFPKANLIVLAESFSEATAFPLLQLGVKGILQYSEAATQLPRAMQSVANGGYWVPRSLLSRFVETILTGDRGRHLAVRKIADVSKREQEILDALLENLSNKEIATKLNISERTVKFHVSNLLSKYGVQRRADLIVLSFHNQKVVVKSVQ